jgi:hypothetical protein
MGIANFLATILGIFLVTVPLSLLVNPRQLKNIFSAFENEFLVYSHGMVLFLLGIVIVLLHNVWILNWDIIVTIAGWLFVAKGLFLLFFTKDAVELTKRMKDNKYLAYFLLIVFFLGLKFLYFGFIGK